MELQGLETALGAAQFLGSAVTKEQFWYRSYISSISVAFQVSLLHSPGVGDIQSKGHGRICDETYRGENGTADQDPARC